MLADGPLQEIEYRLRDLALLDQIGAEGQAMQCEILPSLSEGLFGETLIEDLRFFYHSYHVLSLLHHSCRQSSHLSFGNDSYQCFLEGQRQKFLFPIIGASEAIALREEDDIFLIIDIWLSFIQSYFSIEDQVQTFCLLLFLVHKALLSELGEEHRPADVIDSGEVFDALDGLEVEQDAGEGVEICDCPFFRLAHQDLEDETEVVLFYVVEV